MKRNIFFILLCSIILLGSCGDEFTKPIPIPEPEPTPIEPLDTLQMQYKLVKNSRGERITITGFPNIKDVVIPAEIEIDGISYPVINLSNESRHVSNIKTIHIPSSIKIIWVYSFSGIELEAVYIEDLAAWCNISFTYGPDNDHDPSYDYCSVFTKNTRFYVNNNLVKTLIIPDDVEIIRGDAFVNLDCMMVDTGNVKTIEVGAFHDSSLKELVLSENLVSIQRCAFMGCYKLKELTLPATLEYVGRWAFTGCGIEKVYAPSAETIAFIDTDYDINYYSEAPFGYSYDLYINNRQQQDIVIEALKEDLGNECFTGVNNVRSLYFKEGIISAGNYSFQYCKSLKSLTLPSTLEKISTRFDGCPALESITLKSPIPPGYKNNPAEFDYVNKDVAANCTLYVPEESIDLYKAHGFWGQFNNIKPISES